PIRKYGPSMMVRVTGSRSCVCSVAVSAIVIPLLLSLSSGGPRPCAWRGALSPELLGGQPRSLRERLELRPHHTRVDALRALALREAAVRPGDHVLASHQLCKADDPIGD